MSKRVHCKFYAHGGCLKGEHCEFSHDWKVPPRNICTFYQKGTCSYGSGCRYEHVKASWSHPAASSSSSGSHQAVVSNSVSLAYPSASKSSRITATPDPSLEELSALSKPFRPANKHAWVSGSREKDALDDDDDVIPEPRDNRPADLSICSFAAAGNCPHGGKCPHLHGDLCSICGKYCLHPFRPDERDEHTVSCQKKHKQLELLKHSQDIECSVCLERVLSKSSAAERKFGVLSECDHPFCVSCIRSWRSSSPTSGFNVNTALRACPICRKVSYFVIPSVTWYSTEEEKKEIIDSYKTKLRSIDCKHFKFGNGNCPFGSSCFYKHFVKPGSYAWVHHRAPGPRRPPRRSDVTSMGSLMEMFDQLGMLESILDGVDDYGPGYFDDEDDDDLTPEHMDFLLAQMGLGESDLSSDDELIF